MSNQIYYPATLTPYKDSNGYMITFRDVPEAITGDDTFANVVDMAEDCIKTAREFYTEDDRSFPVPSRSQKGDVMIPLTLEDGDELWYRATKSAMLNMT